MQTDAAIRLVTELIQPPQAAPVAPEVVAQARAGLDVWSWTSSAGRNFACRFPTKLPSVSWPRRLRGYWSTSPPPKS